MAERALGSNPMPSFEGGFSNPNVRGQSLPLSDFTQSPSTGTVGVSYRMRGFDTNGSVNSTVYWTSTSIDSTATDYTGSAGPVINIVVSDIIGA